MKKITSAIAALFVAVGLLLGAGGAPAMAAISGGISQPDMNRCQYVTVPPKLPSSNIACWNFLLNPTRPAACLPTKVWRCYQV
jgi:hypothetical protein